MSTAARRRADACPGVFAPHDAADGALARVRLPGGVVTADQVRTLAGCALDLGDGSVHLTSRANLQLRGLDRHDPTLARRLLAAGLLPSRTHERVRNVLASPLSGVRGGLADVRGLASLLDRLLCASAALAGLSGRFLFALDDGRGDVLAHRPDLCWRACGPDHGTLLVAGGGAGPAVPIRAAVSTLVRAATAFLRLRADDGGAAWRACEIPDAGRRIAAMLGADLDLDLDLDHDHDHDHDHDLRLDHNLRLDGDLGLDDGRGDRSGLDPAGEPGLVGPIRRDDGGTALGAVARLGALSVSQLRVLADAAPEIVVTPWRTVLLPEPVSGAAAALAAAGLIVDPHDPARWLSACAGRPGCAKALADVRADATAVLDAGVLTAGKRVHVSGCDRRCGAPAGRYVDVVATPNGYRIDDGRVSRDTLARALTR